MVQTRSHTRAAAPTTVTEPVPSASRNSRAPPKPRQRATPQRAPTPNDLPLEVAAAVDDTIQHNENDATHVALDTSRSVDSAYGSGADSPEPINNTYTNDDDSDTRGTSLSIRKWLVDTESRSRAQSPQSTPMRSKREVDSKHSIVAALGLVIPRQMYIEGFVGFCVELFVGINTLILAMAIMACVYLGSALQIRSRLRDVYRLLASWLSEREDDNGTIQDSVLEHIEETEEDTIRETTVSQLESHAPTQNSSVAHSESTETVDEDEIVPKEDEEFDPEPTPITHQKTKTPVAKTQPAIQAPLPAKKKRSICGCAGDKKKASSGPELQDDQYRPPIDSSSKHSIPTKEPSKRSDTSSVGTKQSTLKKKKRSFMCFKSSGSPQSEEIQQEPSEITTRRVSEELQSHQQSQSTDHKASPREGDEQAAGDLVEDQLTMQNSDNYVTVATEQTLLHTQAITDSEFGVESNQGEVHSSPSQEAQEGAAVYRISNAWADNTYTVMEDQKLAEELHSRQNSSLSPLSDRTMSPMPADLLGSDEQSSSPELFSRLRVDQSSSQIRHADIASCSLFTNVDSPNLDDDEVRDSNRCLDSVAPKLDLTKLLLETEDAALTVTGSDEEGQAFIQTQKVKRSQESFAQKRSIFEPKPDPELVIAKLANGDVKKNYSAKQRAWKTICAKPEHSARRLDSARSGSTHETNANRYKTFRVTTDDDKNTGEEDRHKSQTEDLGPRPADDSFPDEHLEITELERHFEVMPSLPVAEYPSLSKSILGNDEAFDVTRPLFSCDDGCGVKRSPLDSLRETLDQLCEANSDILSERTYNVVMERRCATETPSLSSSIDSNATNDYCHTPKAQQKMCAGQIVKLHLDKASKMPDFRHLNESPMQADVALITRPNTSCVTAHSTRVPVTSPPLQMNPMTISESMEKTTGKKSVLQLAREFESTLASPTF